MSRLTSSLLVLALACGLAPSLFAQGLTTTAAKEDWEEINFEFNSSVLSDGYPSLLRLAELLNQNPGHRVRIEGHTDWVGSDSYNDKLAVARAGTVKSFLVKYGARDGQITTSAAGKRDPKVDNKTAEGRFMNRRVILTVTDAQGRLIGTGGVGDAIKALSDSLARSTACCEDILKRLDKLDEILAVLKDLRTENDRLKQDVAALKQDAAGQGKAQAALQQQVAQLPRPPERAELAQMMDSVAQRAIEETRPKRFQLMGINLGLDTTGNLTVNGRGRYFAPFGENLAFQAGAEYFKFLDRQEGQVDVGLIDRYKNFQAGLFSSFKRVELTQYNAGGTLGQAAVAMDYLFYRGRLGVYGTKAFLDDPVVHRLGLTRTLFRETYLSVVDQVGGSAQIALHKDAYMEGNLGALFRRGGSNRPGGTVRFVQPINSHWAFTAEAGLNETLLGASDTGRVAVGLQFGNWLRPKEYRALNHAVPMDVPRIRYELLTRTVRNGNDPPVADAGPDQIGVSAGPIQLDGSGSYDPEGDPVTFAWTQISGPAVSLTGANAARASFTAAAGVTYVFRLSVTDNRGAEGRARVTITTAAAPAVKIVRYAAEPAQIVPGQASTIVWEVLNAEQVTISGIGSVDPAAGTSTVAPARTTTYTLTARNRTSEVSQAITVTVTGARILRFTATPATIVAGQASTLAWETEGSSDVSISGIGTVQPSGAVTVSPAATTTYTLTARGLSGEATATATVRVTPSEAPRILRFLATPVEILPGEQSSLLWQVENASTVTITGIGAVGLTGSSTVSPAGTTTYTITATNQHGSVSATATVGIIETVKILDFRADTLRTARAGDPAVLSWRTENATEVIITGVGPVPVNGSITVNPATDTTYTLVAYGRRSQVSAVLIVRVGANNAPVANAGPSQVVMSSTITLDGSLSYDPDGDPITYSWRVIGNARADIYGANTARPSVLLSSGYASYVFELTVTDSKRASSTATVRVNYYAP